MSATTESMRARVAALMTEEREVIALAALRGATTGVGMAVTTTNPPPLDVGWMQAMFDTLPLAPFWASSVLFARDHAVGFTHKRRPHLGAHPDFWARLPARSGYCNPLTSIEIVDLDVDDKARERWSDAIMAAMTEHEGPSNG